MTFLLLFGLLFLNTAISAWNGYAAGRIWRECSGFMKLVAWSAVIMSACGFISVSAAILAMVAQSAHWINAVQLGIILKLTYVMIIIPILGAGLIITIHSWLEFIRKPSLIGGATTAWNTYAQASNMVDAYQNFGHFIGDISSFFKSDDSEDSAGGLAVLLIVALATVIGGGATFFFWNKGLRASSANAPALSRN